VVERLANPNGGDPRLNAEVARKAKAIGMEDAVAIDKDHFREQVGRRPAQLIEQADQEGGLSEGEVAGDVGRREHHTPAHRVHHLQRVCRNDDQGRACISLAALNERDVRAADEAHGSHVDKVSLDQLGAQPTLSQPPPPSKPATQ